MVGENILGISITLFIFLIVVLSIWDFVWKGIALWYSARRKQKTWFVLILILNTMGILPIIYLLIHRKRKIRK